MPVSTPPVGAHPLIQELVSFKGLELSRAETSVPVFALISGYPWVPPSPLRGSPSRSAQTSAPPTGPGSEAAAQPLQLPGQGKTCRGFIESLSHRVTCSPKCRSPP